MILYYAMGGGLGHLTRGRRVLEALGIEDASFVTSSPYASDPRVTGAFPVIRVPSNLEGNVVAHREWLRSLACRRLIVDTFPCGIQGELSGLDVPMDLVARRLRWDEYRRAVPHRLPEFERVWQLEELERKEQDALECVARSSLLVALASARKLTSHEQRGTCHDFWLIVHSGPADEVRELVAHAQELQKLEPSPERVLVATRCVVDLPPGYELIDAYPVTHLFPRAARIISAAGFNVMLETDPYRDKHHAVPFARRFDDQFARAAARRRVAACVWSAEAQLPPHSMSYPPRRVNVLQRRS